MSDDHMQHRKRVIRRQYHRKPDSNDNAQQQQQQQQQQQYRSTSPRRKPQGLICSVCAGPAHGYNFDTITCESCKAFFRRNALRTDVHQKFKCRSENNQCVITVSTRKRCKACRLAKCFAKGMRADWILTDEERMNKKQKIEDNRRLRQTLYPHSSDTDEISDVERKIEPLDDEEIKFNYLSTPPSLFSEDLLRIDHIQKSYATSVRLTSLPPEIPSYPHRAYLEEASSLMNLAGNLQSTRLITFFKLIPEFSSLNEHDKIVLIKYNTFSLLYIRSALIYDPVTDCYYDRGTDDCVFEGKDLIHCLSLHQYQQTTRCIRGIMDAAQNDYIMLRIFLLINVFSKGSSICTYIDEAEPIADDILSIYRKQNIFIELMWKYCEKMYGSIKAIDIWLKLVVWTIDGHLQAYNTQYNYIKIDTVADRLVPLMQSVILNV